jgi:HAD superfamily hydrolase (TIGR01509 family)
MPKIKAAIFDMDGLIIDSEPFWQESHIKALKQHGVQITRDDVRKVAGTRTDEVVQHWIDTYDLSGVYSEELEHKVITEVIKRIRLNGKELPGVRKLISILEKQSIPIAVASSSSPEIIDAVLDKLKLRSHIKLACSAKFELRGKPDPGVFITTAIKLGVEPANCIVFEDALSGIKAAKSAGMVCVAVPEDINMDNQEIKHLADLVVPSLDVLSWPVITKLF